jgi:hypothetical protein
MARWPSPHRAPSAGAAASVLVALAAGLPARAEWRIVDHGSRWSSRRPLRPHTRYIVLHTTEGAERGALEKLAREGEAHYLVGEDGTVHRLVDRRRIATHAGRSLWEGRANLDEHSLGIEVVGYHDEAPNPAQIAALKELLRQLQSLYRIPDARVLTHSMVAYGAPNRWHRKRHRGRKRCAMRLAAPRLRRALGLDERPPVDPDVEAGRLVVADPDLFDFLFPKTGEAPRPPAAPACRRGAECDGHMIAAGRSPWDIAKEAYDAPETVYLFPDGARKRGDEIRDWRRIPPGTRVERGAPEEDATRFEGFSEAERAVDPRAIAGEEHDAATTIYLFPSGLVRTGAELRARSELRFLLEEVPAGTRILVGYQYGGYVSARRPPSVICGARWSYPSTFYRFPSGEIRSGDTVDAGRIPKNTLVFMRR